MVPIAAIRKRPSARGCGLLWPYTSVHSGNSFSSSPGSVHVRPPSRESMNPVYQS